MEGRVERVKNLEMVKERLTSMDSRLENLGSSFETITGYLTEHLLNEDVGGVTTEGKLQWSSPSAGQIDSHERGHTASSKETK